MIELLGDISGVEILQENILEHAKTLGQHDAMMSTVLKIIKDSGLR